MPNPTTVSINRLFKSVIRLIALTLTVTACEITFAQNWSPTSAPIGGWTSIAVSSNGNKIVAVDSNVGPSPGTNYYHVYTSANGGLSWTQTSAPYAGWECTASSADGVNLVAGIYSGKIYRSTNSGATWTGTSAPNGVWGCIASSQDGSVLVAGGSYIYVSTDSGATWQQRISPMFGGGFGGVACSAQGDRMVAVGASSSGDYVYWSTNYGTSWLRATNVSPPGYAVLAASTNLDVVAVASYQYDPTLLITTNAGATWTRTNIPSSGGTIALSGDGKTLTVASRKPLPISPPPRIYTSTNFGATWITNYCPTNSNWTAIATSTDGSKLVAGSEDGHLYVSPPNPPSLNAVMSTNGVQLSLDGVFATNPVVISGSTDLTKWLPLYTNPPTTGSVQFVDLTLTNAPNRFYRAQQ